MTVTVQFLELGADPVQVLFGLEGSPALAGWPDDPAARAAVAALDQLPWGTRPATTPDAVRAVGELLRTTLVGLPTLKNAMSKAFAVAPGLPARRPIYFRVGYQSWVEAFPFEALWDDHNATFPCLQQSWPIARIPGDATPPAGPFAMEQTIRLVAVLAAEGILADQQVAALRTACAAHPALPVEVTVITSSTALCDSLAATAPGWRADLVPEKSDELIMRLIELQPHLLHLFCHGTADGPRLLVAQRDDLSVLEIGATQFAGLAQPAFIAPWLVTLNCCESAAPGTETASLTSSLVRSGLPAALGMRRAVDATMADRFCADLYSAVLEHLEAIAPTGRAGGALDWPGVLHEPRRRLAAAHGDPTQVAVRQKEWTMPVLYVAAPTMWIRGIPAAPGLSPAQVREELTTLFMADGLGANGQLTPAQADRLRAPALARLYP